jgi:hypothetical protein
VNPKTISPDIFQLLHKIKALADRGIDGERIVAQHKLNQLLQAHGLSLSDLSAPNLERFHFTCCNEKEVKLLINISLTLCPSMGNQKTYSTIRLSKQKIQIGLMLTMEEYQTLVNAFRHYAPMLREEIRQLKIRHRKENKFLFSAFCGKNDIDAKYCKRESKSEPLSLRDMERIIAMMRDMEANPWKKENLQITGGVQKP